MEEYVNVTSDGGVKKKILKEGSGDTPKKGQTCVVLYKGTFKDGKMFDESKDGFEFKVGIGQVIQGWDIGVLGMKLGEKSNFYIRSDYAYGKRGAGGVIPPNTDLMFDVELKKISKF